MRALAYSLKLIAYRVRQRLAHFAFPTSYKLQPESSRTSRGFTLIETFVAIAILVTAVAGPLTVASKGLQSALLAKDQLTASFLAQEGLEYVRELRDNNCLQNGCTSTSTGLPIAGVWLAGATLNNCVNKNCEIDTRSGSVTACPGNVCDPLHYDTSTGNATSGFYTYNSSDSLTSFVRSITIVPSPNLSGREATVTSTVSWKTGPYTRQIVITEILSDWQ